MYPDSKAAASDQQRETERAIAELVRLALDEWLPLARAAVDATDPPDPSAVTDVDAEWDRLVDEVLLYGIGLIAAHAYDQTYTALAGERLTADRLLPQAPDEPSLTAALPSRDTLRRRVGAILQRRLGIDADDVDERARTVPSVSAFVSAHLGAIRGRIMDAVGRVFRRSTKAVETDDAEAEQAVFDPLDAEWESAADEVGQTQATTALNAAANAAAGQAATDTGRSLVMEWVAILDTHTRTAHRDADGQRQPIGASFDVGGEQLRFPGDPAGSIENTINCRCRVFAFFADEPPRLTAAAAPAIATMTPENEERTSMGQYRSFTAVLAVIGTPTDDGRMFDRNIDLSFRDFPLPLMWQKQSAGGHYNAYTVGVIESAGVVGTKVIGEGYLLHGEEADEAAEQISHGVTGPSVDLGDVEWELRDKDGNPISEDDWWDDPDLEVISVVMSAKVLAATLVATPAFGDTSITLGEMVERGEQALTAAADMPLPGLIDQPVYDAKLFENPNFDGPTLPHMTPEGRIQGHLAVWNVCHVGIKDQCVMAPRSATDYAWFHTSPPLKTTDGSVKVGRLTVGGGHASPSLSAGPAIAHYDDVGTCFALVHVGEDAHGVWFSGVPAPGATEEQIAKGLAAPLSGDWRNVGGNLELVAALAVNTPGFPILASGATDERDEPRALVASLGPCSDAAQTPRGTDGLPTEVVRDFVKIVLDELRAGEQRRTEAQKLVDDVRRAEAAALIAEVQ